MILKVLQKKEETENVFSLILEKPKYFNFYAGQYLDVELPVKNKFGKTRAFTISSSPSEEFLMITPKKGINPFKKFMENLKVGDTITSSHPAGTFTLDESQPAVFIAGGIGITPFRSMIRYVLDNKLTTPITLIYSNSDSNFPFKNELNQWQKNLSNLNVIYIVTGQNGRPTKLPTTRYQLPIYYLAGPPKMVDDFANMLLELGIDEINIRYDRFDGY